MADERAALEAHSCPTCERAHDIGSMCRAGAALYHRYLLSIGATKATPSVMQYERGHDD